MAWDLAPSLKTLRSQVNTAHPNRSKKSDGTIGDAAHAKTRSDHNPNPQGIVCALDLTHDPANGMDCQKFLDAQLANPHPTAKYFVWQGHIYSRKYDWRKRPSSGHFNHIHISVGVGSDGQSAPGTYNNTSPWNLGGTPMSADRLTKEEVTVMHRLAFNVEPNAGTFGWVGQPLSAFLTSIAEMKATLRAQVKDGRLVPKGASTFDKDALYADQLLATKKVFGK